MALSTVQAAGILAAILATEQQRQALHARQVARQQRNAKRWRQFEATAATLLSGTPATTGKHCAVAEQLAAWRRAPAAQRDVQFPRLAPLLHQSRHACLRELGACADPETLWLDVHVRGLFEGQHYDGQIMCIDRDVRVEGEIQPLQLLVRYEDGDNVHLDECEAQSQAQAYQVAHQSQSRLFAKLGTAPLPKRRRITMARYCPAA